MDPEPPVQTFNGDDGPEVVPFETARPSSPTIEHGIQSSLASDVGDITSEHAPTDEVRTNAQDSLPDELSQPVGADDHHFTDVMLDPPATFAAYDAPEVPHVLSGTNAHLEASVHSGDEQDGPSSTSEVDLAVQTSQLQIRDAQASQVTHASEAPQQAEKDPWDEDHYDVKRRQADEMRSSSESHARSSRERASDDNDDLHSEGEEATGEVEIPMWERTGNDPERVRYDLRRKVMGPIKGNRTVKLMKVDNTFGLSFIGPNRAMYPDAPVEGIYISKIVPGGPADQSEQLFVGDRIMMINGIDVRKSDHLEALVIFRSSKDTVILDLVQDPEGFAKSVLRRQADDQKSNDNVNGDPNDNDEEQAVLAFEDKLETMSNSCISREQCQMDTQLGYQNLLRGNYAAAEEHLLHAIGTVIDERMEDQIRDAIVLTNPKLAQHECDMLMFETETGKGGLYYMLGLAVHHQRRTEEAVIPFRIAVLSILPWCFFPGMPINANDVEFHRTIGATLFSKSKFFASHIAAREVRKYQRPLMQWEEDIEKVCATLPLVPPLRSALVPSAASSSSQTQPSSSAQAPPVQPVDSYKPATAV